MTFELEAELVEEGVVRVRKTIGIPACAQMDCRVLTAASRTMSERLTLIFQML